MRAKIAGLELSFASFSDMADYFDHLARKELDRGLCAKTQKEVRFHEGKMQAYAHACELFRAMTE